MHVRYFISIQFSFIFTLVSVHVSGAEVRSINFTQLFGSGVLHTKMWIVDGQHFYVGSANMDWRSLTQVPELVCFHCSAVVVQLIIIIIIIIIHRFVRAKCSMKSI